MSSSAITKIAKVMQIEHWYSIMEPHDLECPFCHSPMHKIYSSVGISFKGRDSIVRIIDERHASEQDFYQ
jgi:predicted nucleic acid-binding Zn ribbon protein